MKKYLFVIIAVITAVICFAFTCSYDSEVKRTTEDCPWSQRKWYIMKLPCEEQNEFEDYLNVDNYRHQNYPGEINDPYDGCNGTECMCAIYACSQFNGKIYIPPYGDTWYALQTYFNLGAINGGIIIEKDQYWGR